MSDVLSDVLRAIRLDGAFFVALDGIAPWVIEALPSAVIGPRLLPDAEHVIEYHVVTAGGCWVGLLDEPPVWVEAGDVIAFPQGDSHVLSSAPGMRGGPELDSVLGDDQRLPVLISLGSAGTEKTSVICGFLGFNARAYNPLLAALPRMLHVRGKAARGAVMHQLVEMAVAESSVPRSGSACMLARVSELLFVEVVRQYADHAGATAGGWLAGLQDPIVSRALERIHERPAHPWTLEELAKEAAASRTILAERFTQLVGLPPIQYLAKWRIQVAAGLLRSTTASLGEIAERVGYGSEAALGRAFKRLTGLAPAAYRRGPTS